jgi:hypothetical protein
MLTDDGELVKVAARKTQVPWPNNTLRWTRFFGQQEAELSYGVHRLGW